MMSFWKNAKKTVKNDIDSCFEKQNRLSIEIEAIQKEKVELVAQSRNASTFEKRTNKLKYKRLLAKESVLSKEFDLLSKQIQSKSALEHLNEEYRAYEGVSISEYQAALDEMEHQLDVIEIHKEMENKKNAAMKQIEKRWEELSYSENDDTDDEFEMMLRLSQNEEDGSGLLDEVAGESLQ